MTPVFENVEYEKTLLCQLMIENSLLDTIKTEPDDFSSDINRRIFNAIRQRYTQHEPANLQTLASTIPKALVYLSALTSVAASTSNITFYEKELKKLRLSRALKNLGINIGEMAGCAEPDEIITHIESVLTEMSMKSGHEHSVKIGELISPTIDKIESAYKAKGKITGITTGFPTLDYMLDGFHDSELIIIAARTSIGKSAISLQMAETEAISNVKVAFLSLEMPNTSLTLRLMAKESNIDQTKLRRGLLRQSDFAGIMEAGGKLYNLPLDLYDKPNMSIDDVLREARWLKRQNRIEILFIDYMGLIKYRDQGIPRFEQISAVSKELKQLARELNIPIVVLSQLGRQSEGKVPSVADLRDSGSVEENSDVVILLHRDRKDDQEDTKVIIAKQRNGPLGEVKMRFFGALTKFVEIEEKRE
jgi:replicative DNA helicase